MTGIYGLIHMAVDLSCAFLMYAFVVGGEHWYIWLLAYNFCAFALQMPIGAGADRLDRNSLVATGGCGGVLCGLVLAMAGMPSMASVIAGIGNACFHVGGGIDVMNRSGNRAALLGMFVAPGALGIVLGSSIGRYGNRITEGTMRVGTALALAMAVPQLSASWLNGRGYGGGRAMHRLPMGTCPFLSGWRSYAFWELSYCVPIPEWYRTSHGRRNWPEAPGSWSVQWSWGKWRAGAWQTAWEWNRRRSVPCARPRPGFSARCTL